MEINYSCTFNPEHAPRKEVVKYLSTEIAIYIAMLIFSIIALITTVENKNKLELLLGKIQ